MDLAVLFKVAHAVLGVWIIAAVVGRWVTLDKAAASQDLRAVHTLLDASERFERWARQIPTIVLVLGILTAVFQSRPVLGPLQGAPVDWLFVSLVVYLSVIPWIPLVFLPKGRVFAAALARADEGGRVTPELTAAFHDRTVFAGHVYEIAALVTVFVLMITKPF
ncbi:MAG TPA: DUF2269 family protein [Candidatus Limnocylindrales bacterium]|nr:DUF2269 family protein [Candidatus Limnocylindrales bacterium]